MDYLHLTKKYAELEQEVSNAFLAIVEKSKYNSKLGYLGYKVIDVSQYDTPYQELGFIDGRLMFIDYRGLLFSFYVDFTIEEAINLLNVI